MSNYIGDFDASDIVDLKFTTVGTTGAPTTLAGTPAISVYKDNSTTQSTTGVTLTVDFDSVTGLHHVRIDTSADGSFYAAGSDFQVVITTGTVGGTSVVGYVVGAFSIRNRAAIYPTTAGRTLDVSAGGEAGVDWANVGSPTTTLNLSGTTVKTATDVETDTADIQSRLPAALVGGRIDANVGAISGDATAADNLEAAADGTGFNLGGGSVVAASVTGAVGSVTGNVGGNVTGTIGGLATAAKAEVQLEAEEALQTYHLDHLIQSADPGSIVADSSIIAKLTSKSATPAFSSYNNQTDSLEAIRDRGDAAWTGTGATAEIRGTVTKSGSTYYVSYVFIYNGAVIAGASLSSGTVTFYDEDGTDLTYSAGTPTINSTGIVHASGTLGTAVTDNRPLMVKLGVTYNAVAYTSYLTGANVA